MTMAKMAKKIDKSSFKFTDKDMGVITRIKKLAKERDILREKERELQDLAADLYSEEEQLREDMRDALEKRLLQEAKEQVKTMPKMTDDGREITYEILESYNEDYVNIPGYACDEDYDDFDEKLWFYTPHIKTNVGSYPLTPEQAKELKAAKAIVAKYANMSMPKNTKKAIV